MQKYERSAMKSTYQLSLLFIFLFADTYSQDTVLVGPKYEYSSLEHPHRGKAFASSVKYGREDIIFSPNHKRIEYCYYYDSKRISYGSTYEIVNDSVLFENGVKWLYQKVIDSLYQISSVDSSTQIIETGYCTSLIPLSPHGRIYSIQIHSGDTLWSSSRSKICFHPSTISGKIYEYNQVDAIPQHLNGESLNEHSFDRANHCLCEAWITLYMVSFIVTKEGQIKNIRQAFGSFSSHCPYDLARLTGQLASLKVSPATVNGEPVNCRWFMDINMDETGNRKLSYRQDLKKEHIKHLKEKKYWESFYKCDYHE
jgi:hypothetical protein